MSTSVSYSAARLSLRSLRSDVLGDQGATAEGADIDRLAAAGQGVQGDHRVVLGGVGGAAAEDLAHRLGARALEHLHFGGVAG